MKYTQIRSITDEGLTYKDEDGNDLRIDFKEYRDIVGKYFHRENELKEKETKELEVRNKISVLQFEMHLRNLCI